MHSDAADPSPAARRPLFRERALERSGRIESIDGLLRVTAPHEWVILAAVAVALCVLGAWAVFGTIERGITAPCIVAQPGERHHAVATAAGTVNEVLVRPGDQVEAGQPVALITDGDFAAMTTLAAARLAALEAGEAASHEVAAARRELDFLAEMQAAGSPVRSPAAGVVTAVAAAVGDQVLAGAELAVVGPGGTDDLAVYALLDAPDAARVDPGMEAHVSLVTPASSTSAVAAAEVDAFVAGTAAAPAAPAWTPTAAQRIAVLSFDSPSPAGIDDGSACDVRIITVRQRPIGLLAGFAAPGGR
ncbi:MAG: HlyD family efflux transporter periplasmic adaptor subunit [Acidimicrobiaceae bacterium]|nr:HlyD family efflux transporter periplasmic adaptor subunit [Acidimicrobiaceae bacterium]